MGNSSSCLEVHPDYPSEVDIETDLGIEGELVNDKICNSKVQRVLLLGSAGAGKSTLCKHAKQIYGQSYKDDDRRAFVVPIHKQIIEQMKLCIRVYIEWNHRQTQRKEYQMRMAAKLHIIDEDIELDEETKINNDNEDANAHSLPELIQDCSEELDELLIWDQIELKCPALQNEQAAQMVLSFQQESQPFDEEIGSAVDQLWNEPIVKEIYALRNITCVEASLTSFNCSNNCPVLFAATVSLQSDQFHSLICCAVTNSIGVGSSCSYVDIVVIYDADDIHIAQVNNTMNTT